MLINPVDVALVDDFNRGSLGANWSTGGLSTVDGPPVIVSNMIARAAAGVYRQGGWYNVRRFARDLIYIAEIGALPDTDADGFTFFFRGVKPGDANASGYKLGIDRNDAGPNYAWHIDRIINGAFATISGSNGTQIVAATDRVAAIAHEGDIGAWYQALGAGAWTLQTSASDKTFYDEGYVGVEQVGNQSARINNIWVADIARAVSPDSSAFPKVELRTPRTAVATIA